MLYGIWWIKECFEGLTRNGQPITKTYYGDEKNSNE